MFRYEVPRDGLWHQFLLRGPIRHVAARDTLAVEFWAEDDADADAMPERLYVVGTGWAWPSGGEWVGTALAPDGMVWHLLRDGALPAWSAHMTAPEPSVATPPPDDGRIRDGHTARVVANSGSLSLVVVCPWDNRDLSGVAPDDIPPCRVQYEGGIPARWYGPADQCVVQVEVDDAGHDVLYTKFVSRDPGRPHTVLYEEIEITTLPCPISYWWDDADEAWYITPEPGR